MRRLGDKLLGNAGRVPFEQRIFHFVMLLGAGMTLFGTVMDVFYRAAIVLDLVFLGCWIIAYYFSRFKGQFHAASMISAGVLVFCFLPYNWIISGGASGVIPYYTIVFMAVLCLIYRGTFRAVMVCSMFAVELLLIGYDAIQAGSILALIRSNLRPMDFLIHLSVILTVTAALVIVYSNTYMKEKERGETYSRTIREYYRQQLYYMENLEQMIYKLKGERHDFNNHLGVVYGLLESGEAEQAREYAAQLIKTTREYQNIVHIPYPMVRAMLNYKLSAARESGIELKLNVLLPEGLALDEFDVTVILGNLLDNAVEACAVVEPGGRSIGLEIRYQPDYLVIQVENPTVPGAVGGPGRSTKPDAGEHGFGLNNIEYLAARHNGLLDISQGSGVFRANVALLVHMRP
jgi:two-component system sensor histidine kinase AgrC